MATVTLNSTSTLFVASAETSYSAAREGTGVNRYVAEFGWVGQYLSGGNYEVDQVFASFDLSSLPTDALITGAKLVMTVAESYGTHTIEARSSTFTAGSIASFIPGSGLAAKTLLGSAVQTDGFVVDREIVLSGFDRTNLASVVLFGQGQRTGTAPTGEVATRITGVKLEVTFTPQAPNKEPLTITDTGAGTWTPTFTGWVYGEAWGGGGVSKTERGGGGAYSAGWFPVTAGVPVAYYVAGRQFGGYQNGESPNIVGEDSWIGNQTTILAKGANAVSGGQAASGFGEIRFSGGSGSGPGGGASASPYGGGENGSYPTINGYYYEAGGSSPQAGLGALYPDNGGPLVRFAESHPDGGGAGADIDQCSAPGDPGGGAGEWLTWGDRMTSRGQVRFSWFEQTMTGGGSVSLSSPRAQGASTFTQPARVGDGTFSLAPQVTGTAISVVPINAAVGVSLRSPSVAGLSTFTNPPSGAGVSGSTDWKSPGSLQTIVDGFRSWSPLTPTNLATVDGVIVRATGINSTAITHVLRSNNFGFTNADIPAGATITGVEIELVRRRSFGSGVPFARHARLSMDNGGSLSDQIGTNNTTDVEWTNSFTTAPYGGAGDLWGADLTPEMIKSVNFGFDYGLQGGQASMDAAVDQLRMRVHYTAPGGLWAIGVVTTRGPFVNAQAGQNIQGSATVSLTAPSTLAQGFHGTSSSGAVTLSSPSAQASGSHTRVGSGVVVLSSPSANGQGAHGLGGSSAISLASPSAQGSGSHSRVGSGVVSLATPVVAADGQHKVGAQGLVKLGSPSVTAYASRGALASSSVTLTAPTVSAEATHAIGATATVILSNPRSEAQADHGVGGSGSVALKGPSTEAFAETFNEAISTVQIGAPMVAGEAQRGNVAEGQVSLSAPAVEADGSQITGAYSVVRLASPKAEAEADHGVAATSSITLAQPVVQASGALLPQGFGQIVLGSSKVAGVMSQGGFARVMLKGPSVDASGGHGASVHGIVTLTAPSASGEAAAGATGQGNANLVSPVVNALAKRGTASSAAIPLAMRASGDLVHSIAAGGIVSLTVSTDGLADHGVAGEGTISLAAPAVTGSLEPGLVHGSGMVSLGGVSVDGAIFIDLSTIYAQGAVMLGSPSVKGRALTLPTHGQRTVVIDGEQRVVSPPNEPRNLNIQNESRVATVTPE